MSIKLVSKVFDLQIPTAKKFVLLILADHADHAGHSCYPSMERIARHTSMSVEGVRQAIKWLIKAGYVQKLSTGGGRGKRNKYMIIISALERNPQPSCKNRPKPPTSVEKPPTSLEKTPNQVVQNHQGTINNPAEQKNRQNQAVRAGELAAHFHGLQNEEIH